jgi:hypothetical protein
MRRQCDGPTGRTEGIKKRLRLTNRWKSWNWGSYETLEEKNCGKESGGSQGICEVRKVTINMRITDGRCCSSIRCVRPNVAWWGKKKSVSVDIIKQFVWIYVLVLTFCATYKETHGLNSSPLVKIGDDLINSETLMEVQSEIALWSPLALPEVCSTEDDHPL